MVYPSVQIKAIEGYALPANTNFGEHRANLSVKAVAIHAQIGGRVAEAYQAGLDMHCLPPYVNSSNLFSDMADFGADCQTGLRIYNPLLWGQCLFGRTACMGAGPAG